MSEIAEALKELIPEATSAECERFTKACEGDENLDGDQIKEHAEHMLENYLDWRSCYGLDYKKEDNNSEDVDGDAADWKWSIEKALEVEASKRKAQELEKKLADEEAKKTSGGENGAATKSRWNIWGRAANAAADDKDKKVGEVNYDIEFSDSQKSESTNGEEGVEKSGNNNKQSNDSYKDDPDAAAASTSNGENAANGDDGKGDSKMDDGLPDPKKLQQIVYMHKNKNGEVIKDKKGNKILHVFPGMINRVEASGDIYGLAFCFYLDRKFDRESTAKMTVLLDVRAGEGWPNPMAIMMVKFVRTCIQMLQSHYPERLETLYLYPIPRPALRIWHMIRRVGRYGTMEKVVLFGGPAHRNAPLPKIELEEYVDSDVLDFLEEFRLDHFATKIGGPDVDTDDE